MVFEKSTVVSELPPRPRHMRLSKGIIDTSDCDYKIIKKVESFNRSASRCRTPSRSTAESLMSRGRSSSRARGEEEQGEGRRGRSSSRVKNFFRSLSRNGGREREDASVDPNTGKRPQSRGFFGRGRSNSRVREFSDQDDSRDQGDRGRSMSRTGSSRRRSQVEDDRKEAEYDHDTSYQVRKDEQSWDYDNHRQDGSGEENLDRASSSRENMNQNQTKTNSTEVKEEVKQEQQQEEEEDPDALTEEDVMNLDPKNTKVHAACLLHYPAEQIVEQLRENNRLAFKKNSAGEMPLHYAAMDKKGVEFAVLDALIKINRDAVMQPNVQNSLPVHLACMVGAPSSLAIKTFLTLYPDSVMIQNDFPLPFEADMMIEGHSKEEEDEDDIREAPTIPSQLPQQSGGLFSMFACAAPPEAAMEIAETTKPKPKKKKKKQPKVESGFTPLHLAVMNSASEDIIALFIRANPQCVKVKTSCGRTALDCAQYIVRQHWLYGTDDERAVKNTFAAIDILEKAKM